ncbi:MAG: hypothetical protein AAGF24_15250, partial [Cyanobacteria bacterium P01_H01_bin.121]
MTAGIVAKTKKLSIEPFDLALLGVALAAFVLCSIFRTRYIGGSDSYGYYSLAELFLDGRITLPTELSPAEFPNVAPLGYLTNGAEVIPTYQPGYPFLMAIASYLHLQFFVTPISAFLSIIFVYLILKHFTQSAATSFFFAAVWTASPIVLWGGTNAMSDIVATCFGVICFYLLLTPGAWRGFTAGLLLGLSLAIRPTNVLLFPAFAYESWVRSKFRSIYAVVGLVIGGLPIAAWNTHLYGYPWKTGYGSILNLLTPNIFWHHSTHYLSYTFQVLTPIIVLAIIPVIQSPRKYASLVLWFLAFYLFYSFYAPGGDVWWYTRFLVVGYPPLVILSALGAQTAIAFLKRRFANLTFLPIVLYGSLLIAIVSYSLSFANDKNIFDANKQKHYYDDSLFIESV